MWQYNYSNELYHYGVVGMRWGQRRETRDFNKLVKTASKAQKSAAAYSNLTRARAYAKNTDPILNTLELDYKKTAIKHEQKVDKALSKLQKKYKNVSVIPKYDVALGKSTLHVTLNNHKTTVISQYKDFSTLFD